MKFPNEYRSKHPLGFEHGKIKIILSKRLLERFWNKIDKKSIDLCWNWKASKTKQGYGKLIYKNKTTIKNLLAHRISYTIHHNEIPKHLIICHKCNNKLCCNPNHLYAGNHKQNCNDSIKAGTHFKLTSKIGIEHHDSKLKEHEVIEIIKSKLSLSELSNKYKVTKQNIIKIKKRKTWKHL